MLTQQQLQMTKEEMMGGSAGQTAYTKRIADLRAGATGQPATATPATPPSPPKEITERQGAGAQPSPQQIARAASAIPALQQTQPPEYRIKAGDTLSAIAVRQGTTVADLMAANPQIKDPNRIYAGQSLNMPGAGITPPAPPAPPTPPPAPPATGHPFTGGSPKPEQDPLSSQQQQGFEKWKEEARDKGQIAVPTGDEIAGLSEEEKTALMDDFAAKGIPWEMVQSYFESQATALDPDTYFKEAADKYGLEDLETKVSTRPTQTFEEIVTSIYDKLELPKLKDDIDNIRSKIAKAEADRDEAMETINENPWLKEASRVGRISRVQDKAQNELNRLQNQLTLSETLYGRGQDEAKDVATRALNQYSKEREWDIEELNRLTERAVAEAQAKYEVDVAEGVKEAWRYFPQYAEGLEEEEEEKKEYAPPTSYKEWELAGGRKGTGKTYDEWLKDNGGEDPTEKEVTADMKSALMDRRGSDGYISPTDYKKAKNAWFKAGWKKDKFDKEFEMFANPAHIKDYGITAY